jgi:DNA-binding NtrC family response regulator
MSQTAPEPTTILVVDDEEWTLRGVRRTLRSHGFESVLTCSDSRKAVGLIRENRVALLLLDLMMPHVGGEEILAELSKVSPELPVIVVTAEQEVSSAVRCMKLGASDYLVKPVDPEQLVAAVHRTLEHSALRDENARLRDQFFRQDLSEPEAFAHIVTSDASMRRLFAYLEAISRGSQPVLVVGETGTGKELVAKALHLASKRDGPFVAVNVAGLDDTMFSDTLFGHRAGAFTGATSPRKGMIETAASGTLFLDEIGDLTEASQVKLLRLLQEREYHPLGSDSTRLLKARVVAATNRDPSTLRQDLYYRLRSYRVQIPPLRERRGDIGILIDRFAAEAAQDLGRPTPTVPADLLARVSGYGFPGNVRELQALVSESVARGTQATMSLEPFLDLAGTATPGAGAERTAPPEGSAESGPPSQTGQGTEWAPLLGGRVLTQQDWKSLERHNILTALQQAGGKVYGKGGAAQLLDVKPTTLLSRMKALGMDKTTGATD